VIDGIEFKNKMYLTKNLCADMRYTWLNAKDDKTHDYLIYQPWNKADISLRYTGKEGLMLALRAQFTGMRYHDPDNTVKVKEFYVLGFDLSKRLNSSLTYFMSIDNFLNRKYQVVRDYPMPGLTVTSGLKLEF
jgi:vitamin B12 transporter